MSRKLEGVLLAPFHLLGAAVALVVKPFVYLGSHALGLLALGALVYYFMRPYWPGLAQFAHLPH